MRNRVIAALVGMFAVGCVVGVVVANAMEDPAAGVPDPPSEQECSEAREFVDTVNENIATIEVPESGLDASYFAAILSELVAASYAMDERAPCFSLTERAGTRGLIDGIRALAAVADPPPGTGGTLSGPVIAEIGPDGSVAIADPDEDGDGG